MLLLMQFVNCLFAVFVTILLNSGSDALAASTVKEVPLHQRIQKNIHHTMVIACRFLALCCLVYLCYLAGPQWKPIALGCLIGYAGN